MSDEGSSKRSVLLSIESRGATPGSAHVYATDTVTGERLEVLGIRQATICLGAGLPNTAHLEVIPDRINVQAILEHVEDHNLA